MRNQKSRPYKSHSTRLKMKKLRDLKKKDSSEFNLNHCNSSNFQSNELPSSSCSTEVTINMDIEYADDLTNNSFLIEKQANDELSSNLLNLSCGRRVIDLQYFLKEIQNINNHKPFGCSFSDMDFVSENQVGLISFLKFKCRMCNLEKIISTEEKSDQININSAAVLAVISTGCGHSQMVTQQAIMNIPQLSYRQYDKYHQIISKTIFDSMWKSMEEAGKEELALAKEIGDVDKDGNGLITVIADGAWSKRSYKVNYDALSGVGCIVSAKTGKILFVACRNKYCPTCARSEAKNIPIVDHNCFKNWKGSSTAMESDIILEGFKRSVEMHNLKYIQLVGDGDSSVYKKIIKDRPYGANHLVQKVECTNHLLRNYCNRLRDLITKRMSSKGILVSANLRKILKSRVERLRKGIKCAINYRRKEGGTTETQVENLKKDINNCPFHVFGNHTDCASYFCEAKNDNENFVNEMEQCGLMDDIILCGNRLSQNVYSLILNMNNNAAESYNSIVSKFVGGKRINFSFRNSYETRCYAAGLAYNEKEKYFANLCSSFPTKGIGKFTKKYIAIMQRRRATLKIRKERLRYKKRKTVIALPDSDYGKIEDDSGNEDESYIANKDEFLESINLNSSSIIALEEKTRGQSSNPVWKSERSNRLTASNFGLVCKRRATTDPKNIVANIMKHFSGSQATRWGNDHESVAKKQFTSRFNLEVHDCGLFVSATHGYLGASPDGIVDFNSIIEIKCPFSAAMMTVEEAVGQKIVKFLQKIEERYELKRNHNYYYQVQGQLAISNKKFCYFITWTPRSMIVEKIEKDEEFCESMIQKLQKFYLEEMLPKILKNYKI